MMTCYLVVAGSIGLMFFQYFKIMPRAARHRGGIPVNHGGEPAARSHFDVYLRENTVSYLKSPCSAADVQAQFFLRVVPEDVEDLPADRRQYGFDNLDFHYAGSDAPVLGGRCIAERPLPDYPIVRIRTGQFTPGDGRIWEAEFPVGAMEGEPSP